MTVTLGEFTQILSDDNNPESPFTVRRLDLIIYDGKDTYIETIFKRLLPVDTLTVHWVTPDMRLLGNLLRVNKVKLRKLQIYAESISKEELACLKLMNDYRLRTLTIDGEQVYNNVMKIDIVSTDVKSLDHLDCDNLPHQAKDLFEAMQTFVQSECELKWVQMPSKIDKKVLNRFKFEVTRQSKTPLNTCTKVLKIITNEKLDAKKGMWLLTWLNMHFPVIHTLLLVDSEW